MRKIPMRKCVVTQERQTARSAYPCGMEKR